MLHSATGFFASLRLIPPSLSPPARPAPLLPSPSAAPTPPPPTPSAYDRPLPEYAPSTPSNAPEASSFVQGFPQSPLRVYFARLQDVKPIEGTEGVVAFARVDGGRPVMKVYAIGEGVASSPFPMFLDVAFGDLGVTHEQALLKTVQLELYPATIKPGTILGVGHLLGKDVERMTEEEPMVTFTWRYASPAQLHWFGVLPPPATGHSLPPSSTSQSLAFLRLCNRTLLNLMTPTQRLAFVDALAADETALRMLPGEARGELREWVKSGGGGGGGGGGKAGGKGSGKGTGRGGGNGTQDGWEKGRGGEEGEEVKEEETGGRRLRSGRKSSGTGGQ